MKRKNFPGRRVRRQVVAWFGRVALIESRYAARIQRAQAIKTKKRRG